MPRQLVTLVLGPGPLLVGTWKRVPVRVDGQRIPFDELDFKVLPDRAGGQVSLARDESFDPAHPTIMLCVGHRPGRYRLVAFPKAAPRRIVGEAAYELAPLISDGETGQSLWLEGRIEGFVRGATWGGGDLGPENINVTPHTGDWPVAVVLVDTADHRYPTDPAVIQGFKDKWTREAFATNLGDLSAANYYKELSRDRLFVTGSVQGPVTLPCNWAEYFNERTHVDPVTGQTVHEDVWDPHMDLAQSCATVSDHLVDYAKTQSLVIVLPPTKPGSGVWPQAWGWTVKTEEGDRSLSVLVMPNEKPVPHPTLAHELGHNFGLPDLYTPRYRPGSSDADMQNLGRMDLMHWEAELPHMSAMSRMAEGWLDVPWIKTYNFSLQAPPPPVNQPVTLHAIEASPPPANQFAAIEIRLAAGRNYYVEYRAPQAGQIGDQRIPYPKQVIVTDVALPSPGGTVPYDRPRVMFVHKDSDGDGPHLLPTQDFRETDITSPSRDPMKISVTRADDLSADVQISYGPVGKPDPSIRPWPAGPDRQWQSPDIEVRNARTAAYPEWANMPWEGHENEVIAQVTNRGTLDAPGVVANFYVQPYDAAGYSVGAPSFVGSDRKDIPAGQTVEFKTTWVPPDTGHRCISVDIERYVAPGTPPIDELTDSNNFAQSNYVRYISKSSSPFTRVRLAMGVNNPLEERAVVLIRPRQTNPEFRTYLEHSYVTLAPGERREIEVMVEYVPVPSRAGPSDFYRHPNHVSLAAFILPQPAASGTRGGNGNGAPQLLGGVDIDVSAARATAFESFEVVGTGREARLRGRVVATDNASAVPDGTVLLIASRVPSWWSRHAKTAVTSSRMSLLQTGRKEYRSVAICAGVFDIAAPAGRTVQAYYGGGPGFADCYSVTIVVPA